MDDRRLRKRTAPQVAVEAHHGGAEAQMDTSTESDPVDERLRKIEVPLVTLVEMQTCGMLSMSRVADMQAGRLELAIKD